MSAGRCSALAAPHVVTSVVALVIALAAAPLDAQTKVGLRVGFGAATLSGDDPGIRRTTAFDGTRYAIVPSIDAGIPLSGPLGVRLGLGLAQKGGAADVPSSVTTGRALTEAKTELGYFQVSALLRAGTEAQQGDLNFGVLAGPYVGLNLSCNVALTGHETVTPPRPPVPPGEPNRVPALGMADAGRLSVAQDRDIPCGEDGTSEVNSTDFGVAFGAGFEVKLSDSMGLAFELLYARGLSEINDEGKKTNHIVFQTGIVFAIG